MWRTGLFVCIFGTVLVATAAAQQSASTDVIELAPPVKYLVISERARVMAGNDAAGVVPQGTVFQASRSRGPWKFTRDYRGWIHDADLILLARAVDHFTQQIEKNPTSLAHQLRGIAWSAQGEWTKAVTDFERAFNLGENSVALHFNLGLAYRELKDYDRALNEFDTVTKLFPDDYKTLVARAQLYHTQQEFGKELVDLDRALKLRPDVAEHHNERGVALRMLRRYVEAIEAYSMALSIDPKHAESLSNRAFALKTTGNFEGALRDYRAAVELSPKNDDIRNDLAWMLATCPDEKFRRPEEAVSLATAVCESTEYKIGEFVDTLAAAHAAAGDFATAIATENIALRLLENTPDREALQERLKLFEAQKPFFEAPDPGVSSPEPTATPR